MYVLRCLIEICLKVQNRNQINERENTFEILSAIAGIGNIYASEACFLANLHPNTAVQSLTDSDYTNLHRGIVESLNSSIKYGGSSKHTYVNASGGKGYFLEVANVYDRQNQPCRICNTLIIKTTLAGRGTYFCPKCQNG
jgi:formamidopyrimidine-DNA glycosylase